ncbi:transposase [Flavobacterium sp.]|uniref:transposase n=1 Tax=Flavobacterium sp. TaxID=239 RepID=UPI003753B5BE
MDIRIQNLEPDCYFHIYNRGINSAKIFENDENYNYFLKQFSKYVLSVSDVYGYCLMPNHFHFIIKIKSKKILDNFFKNTLKSTNIVNDGLHSNHNTASKQISKFISSYTQSYNKVNNRHGGLLERPFKRKKIDSEEYLRNLIIYIHQNPNDLKVDFREFKYSSYKSILSTSKTSLMRDDVLTLFDGVENFIFCHNKTIKLDLE